MWRVTLRRSVIRSSPNSNDEASCRTLDAPTVEALLGAAQGISPIFDRGEILVRAPKLPCAIIVIIAH